MNLINLMFFHEFYISIKLALKNLTSNAGRTALTLIGIVIGITSVIIISASGQGLQSFIIAQVESYGPDYIQIEPKVPSPDRYGGHMNTMTIQITTLKISDAEAIAKIPNVSNVYAGNLGQALVNYRNTNKKVFLLGAGSQAPFIDAGLKVREGNFYTESEDKSQSQVAVIGSEVKETLFGNSEAVGQDIKIKGQNYRVIGVLEPRGAVAFFNFDALIYVPVRTLQKKIMGIEHVSFITVKAKDVNSLDSTMADITSTLRKRHDTTGPDKDDFIVSSAEEARELIANVFGTINVLLLALTSISLVVGGVGIMNVMYVAAVERTFEIGLRKAVGATNSNILRQFLLESIFIALIGGILGVILGFVLSWLISLIFLKLGYDLAFVITSRSLILAIGFSAATGIIFGFYPAYKASRLNPIDAIRKS